MTENDKEPVGKLLPCEVCLKEIPASAADNEEVDDYVYYFCGANCYSEWQERNEKE